jgi:transposase
MTKFEWAAESRGRYDRSEARYPSDLMDEEWALIEQVIPPARQGGNKRTISIRSVVDGLMYVLSTGCQWTAIPKDLPPRTTHCAGPNKHRAHEPSSSRRALPSAAGEDF